jgi:hypothetical protein
LVLYLFLQKIKYRLRAKNLHGVHSPFVYQFNEQVLNGHYCAQKSSHYLFSVQLGLNQKQSNILHKIIDFYGIQSIHFLDQKVEMASGKDANRLLIFTDSRLIPIYNNTDDIIVVVSPYATQEASVGWQQLIKTPHVPLSIDLFELGILFFRKEFLVKQHFVLRS